MVLEEPQVALQGLFADKKSSLSVSAFFWTRRQGVYGVLMQVEIGLE